MATGLLMTSLVGGAIHATAACRDSRTQQFTCLDSYGSPTLLAALQGPYPCQLVPPPSQRKTEG